MKLVDKFTRHVETFNKYSDNTLIAYETTYKQFNEYLDKQLTEVDIEDTERFIAYLKKNNGGKLSKSTINLKLGALRSLYQYLMARGYVDSDPTKGIDRQSPPKKIKDVLTRREINSMISKVLWIRDKSIISLLFASGMRISELIKLNKDDISDVLDKKDNLQGVKIHIKNAKNYKDRIIYVSERYYQYTRKYLMTRNNDYSALYISKQNNRPTSNTIRNVLTKAADKANIDKNVTPHCMRRSCATYLYNIAHLTPNEIKEQLGHSSVETTLQNYIKVYDDSNKDKVLDAFN
jgi:integrase/recombinase XerD